MSFRLQRHPESPLLLPEPTSDWECKNVFNPSVIIHNGLFHMHYRAQGLDWVSRIGYAVSTDGIHWNRLRQPVLAPTDATDSRGVEDARVVEIDGVFYMTYTAYGREFTGQGQPTHSGGGILPMVARSQNLITWERIAPIVRGEDNFEAGVPESFNVLVKELRSLGLNVELGMQQLIEGENDNEQPAALPPAANG